MIGVDGVGLHQRDDHEAAPVGERAHLERHPHQRDDTAGGRRRRRSHEWPDMGADSPAAPDELTRDLDGAAAEKNEHQPGTDGRRRGATERGVHDPSPVRRRAPPTLRHEAEPGAHGHGGDGRAGAGPRAAHPIRRRTREEDGSEHEDHGEPGKDERRAAHDRADRPRDTPRAEDRQLRRRRARQQVARGDRVLELSGSQPPFPVDAERTQQRDVSGRAAEPGAPDASPLQGHRAEAGRRRVASAPHRVTITAHPGTRLVA